jgi:hypothetical protein
VAKAIPAAHSMERPQMWETVPPGQNALGSQARVTMISLCMRRQPNLPPLPLYGLLETPAPATESAAAIRATASILAWWRVVCQDMRTRQLALVFVIGAATTSCSASSPPVTLQQCSGSIGTPMTMFSVFFGRSVPRHSEVTEREWTEFIEQVATPNLPNGYTTFDGRARWMNPATGKTISKNTKILVALLPEFLERIAAIERVRNFYKERFRQPPVAMTVQKACTTF